MNDEALTYLQGDSHGRRRDLITRCYYEVAQGDPKSGPIVFAVLVNAAAEQFAKTPQELLGVVAEFRKLLAEGREMEARIRERVELSNFGVVSEFKDETRRASIALRETVEQTNRMGEKAARMAREMEPVIATVKQIARDLPPVVDDLKQHRESAKEIAVEVGLVKTIHQENQAFFKAQGKEARANWITTGFLAGILMAAMSFHMPWWEGVMLLVGAIGLLQWLSRQSWNFARRLWKKGEPI
jgi:archaellum component FlaC